MCELMVIIRSRPTYLDKVYPESDGPRLGRNDEGGNQRSHIRRQDNECCPDVDLASPLVKEEHVEDEHQSPTLRDSAEKPFRIRAAMKDSNVVAAAHHAAVAAAIARK